MRILKDYTGLKFGRLTVLKFSHKQGRRKYWECSCSCGGKKIVEIGCAQSGHTRSCGCLLAESTTSKTHGHTSGKRSRTYVSWEQMRQRAHSGTAINAKDYKGRGIDISKDWGTFEKFLEDMGERPEGTSLDRIDNSKGYSKANCRWANKKTQQRNTRATRFITINGETRARAEWCELYNIDCSMVAARMRIGWEPLRALTTPKLK